MSFKLAVKKLGRAFRAKDEAAFDEALEELEEGVEDRRDEEDPAIEVHNHIPGSQIDGIGELPPKDPAGFDARARDNEPPPWFAEHQKATDAFMKRVSDDIAALKKWAGEEGKEPEHQEDEGMGELEHLEEGETDRNMNDRRDSRDRRDRRSDDEPAEREEMAERIRENEKAKDDANKKILGELEYEAPPGTGVDVKKARDSAFLEDSFQDVVSRAEIIAPGVRIPTFDRKAHPVRTGKLLLGLRRTALDLAYHQPETRGIIDTALGGREMKLPRMNDGQVRILFNSVAAAAMTGNNQRATDRSTSFEGRTNSGGARIQTIADINARNREKFGRKSA